MVSGLYDVRCDRLGSLFYDGGVNLPACPPTSARAIMTTALTLPQASTEELARYTVPADKQQPVLAELVNIPQIDEALILSTCQRVEVTACVERGTDLLGLMDRTLHFRGCALGGHWQTYFGLEAVHHLIRVTAGLDSAVIGETEIASQVKTAYQRATECKAVGRHLHAFMKFVIESGKWIRHEYGLESRVAPLGQRVVEAIQTVAQTGGWPEKWKILVIGAGEVGSSVLAALAQVPQAEVTLANRTLEHAQTLARSRPAEVLPWETLPQQARSFEVIVAAAQTEKHVLDVAALADSRLKLLIDLGINPVTQAEKLIGRGVRYLDREMLDAQVTLKKEEREAVRMAEQAINRHVVQFQAEMLAAHAKSALSSHRPSLAQEVRACLQSELAGAADEETLAKIEKRLFFIFSREIAGVLNMEVIPQGKG